MSEEKSPKKDEYWAKLAVRNGWRCRLCGAYPNPGEIFEDGVCPNCRDRLQYLQH